jgi:hypothetical protein
MGFSPQKHRGRAAVYSVLGMFLAFVVGVVVFAAMSG